MHLGWQSHGCGSAACHATHQDLPAAQACYLLCKLSWFHNVYLAALQLWEMGTSPKDVLVRERGVTGTAALPLSFTHLIMRYPNSWRHCAGVKRWHIWL